MTKFYLKIRCPQCGAQRLSQDAKELTGYHCDGCGARYDDSMALVRAPQPVVPLYLTDGRAVVERVEVSFAEAITLTATALDGWQWRVDDHGVPPLTAAEHATFPKGRW